MNNLAQNTSKMEYIPLVGLPGVPVGQKTDLTTYVPALFMIIIGLAAVVAIGRIIWGGIEYITTDSWMGKEGGKEKIKDAVLGLLIIGASWIVLQTINPNLFKDGNLEINLNIESSTLTGGLPTIGGFGGGV